MTEKKEYQKIVSRPGKFEGEPSYTPYYWDMAMDGWGQDVIFENVYYSVLEITSEDVAIFEDLQGYKLIALWEDNNGFVNHVLIESIKEFENIFDMEY